MSWMSSVSFAQPSAVSKNRVHTASPTSSLPPCPHWVEQKVVAISGPLGHNDRSCAAPTECNVLFWKEHEHEHEHGEVAPWLSRPAEGGRESLHLYSVSSRDLLKKFEKTGLQKHSLLIGQSHADGLKVGSFTQEKLPLKRILRFTTEKFLKHLLKVVKLSGFFYMSCFLGFFFFSLFLFWSCCWVKVQNVICYMSFAMHHLCRFTSSQRW